MESQQFATRTDLCNALAEDLMIFRSTAMRLEADAESALRMLREAQKNGVLPTYREPFHPTGTVTVFDTERALMLLVDKLEAISASFAYGYLAVLINELGDDPIQF